jgi:tripartite-type tricarboxylate transporter receptor subunit TctC
MLMARQAKGEFIWIPYDSGTRAITAVMSDIIEAAMSNISVYLTFKERTVVLAHTGETRLEQFPDIPTFKEKGVDIVRYHWRGMFVKRGTPEPAINRLFDGIGRAVKSKRFQDYLHDTATLDGTMSRPAYAQMLEEQAKSDQQVLHEMGAIN